MTISGSFLRFDKLHAFENAFKNKRILVTGHTGFTGGWLSLWLSSIGADVTGLSLEPKTTPNLFTAIDVESFTKSRIGNINVLEDVQNAFDDCKPDVVFHLAAQPLVKQAYDDPLESFLTNVMGTANILEVSRHSSQLKAVVCVTTDKVYADQNWVWGYRETDTLGGKDPYSASKSAAEMVARAYQSTLVDCANGVPIATARGGNIIGGGDWSENRIVPDFIRAHYKGSSLAIRSPSAVRPWQHVIALCHGYLCLAESLLRHGTDFAQGYNFGPADNDITTVAELVECLSSHWPGVKLEYEKGTFAETHLLSVNSAKARSELGWNPPIDFKQTAAWTADWYKNVHDDPGCALKITLDQIKEYRKGLSS